MFNLLICYLCFSYDKSLHFFRVFSEISNILLERGIVESSKSNYFPSLYQDNTTSDLGSLISTQAESLLKIYRGESVGFSNVTQISNSVKLDDGGKLVILFKLEPIDNDDL